MNDFLDFKGRGAKSSASDCFRCQAVSVDILSLCSPNTITRGNRVSPLVPHILSNFKTMEMAGLTMAQMEQALSENIAQNTLNRNFPADNRKSNETDTHPIPPLLEKVVQNQAEMQNEMVKLIKQFYIELSLLQERVAQLEKATLLSN